MDKFANSIIDLILIVLLCFVFIALCVAMAYLFGVLLNGQGYCG